MIIHEIHDLSNGPAVSILSRGLAKITDNELAYNYHPDYADRNSNLFYILKYGRYRKFFGKYYILEEDGNYICSAGWNEYEHDPNVAFALTRMFVDPAHRAKYFVAEHILSKSLIETQNYNKIWLTVNKYNKRLYDWFVRAEQNKRTALFNDWPEVYRRFKPVGERLVYNTPQLVMELKKD
jgi:hypothetical protein